MQSVEKEHTGFAWTGRHAALLPIEQQIWTMTEADIVEAIILGLEFAGDVYEIHGLRLLRMMSTTRMIKQMIPTTKYLIRGSMFIAMPQTIAERSILF
jgi:hypothetical protein